MKHLRGNSNQQLPLPVGPLAPFWPVRAGFDSGPVVRRDRPRDVWRNKRKINFILLVWQSGECTFWTDCSPALLDEVASGGHCKGKGNGPGGRHGMARHYVRRIKREPQAFGWLLLPGTIFIITSTSSVRRQQSASGSSSSKGPSANRLRTNQIHAEIFTTSWKAATAAAGAKGLPPQGKQNKTPKTHTQRETKPLGFMSYGLSVVLVPALGSQGEEGESGWLVGWPALRVPGASARGAR